MRKKILLLVIFALSLFVPAAQANSQELQPQLAPLSQYYLDWLSEQNSPVPLDKASNNSGHATGYIPDPVDFSHLNYKNVKNNSPVPMDKAGTLPSSFSLITEGRVSAVKNQGSYGTCWAHAAMGALESNYLTQGLGSEPNLSELHLAWFVYKDPETGKAFSLNTPSNSVLNQGGNASQSIAFLSRMAGAVNETSMPYTGASTVETDAAGKSPSDYFPRTVFLTEAYNIGNVDSSNRDTVKELVYNNGAVQISYYAGNGATSSAGGVTSYYENSGSTPNHAVLIVGWDDNYDKSNFSTQPTNNGAWLVKNSWGENWPSAGAGGYFYMSYEQNIINATAFVVSDNMPGENYYGYDDLGRRGRYGYGGAKNWMANVFQATNDEKLTAVSFYTTDVNTSYEIYAFNLGSTKPSSPVPSSIASATAIASGTFTYAGYHTVSISSELLLNAGDYFSVIVGVPESANGAIAIESDTPAVVNAGESYFGVGNTLSMSWQDGISLSAGSSIFSANACVKAFTSNVDNSNVGDTIVVEINSTNFPDSTFKNYVSTNFDTNSDNSLSATEIAAITKINVSGKGITDLTGLEYFTALVELSCYGNSLTALDISKNTALEWLDCSDNKLTTLDLSKNTALLKLYCGKNNLTLLDVEANRKLTTIDCHSNSLTALYLNNLSSLTSVTCNDQIIYGISYTSVEDYYTVDLSSLLGGISKAYIETSSFKAYDYDGNAITVSVNSDLWKVTLSDVASYIQYDYSTGYGSTKMPVTLKPAQAPVIITAAQLPSVLLNELYSVKLIATGERPLTWTLSSGSLPTGLTLNGNIISGTPTVAGTYSFTLRASNDYNTTGAARVFNILVGTKPEITTDSDLGYITASTYTSNQLAIHASGTQSITFALEDANFKNKSGLNVSSSGNIQTFGSLKVGTYTFGVVATNSFGSTSKDFKIRIINGTAEPPIITTDYTNAADDDYDYSFTFNAGGYSGGDVSGQTLTWTLESGTLPDGLTLNSDGTLTGTPTENGTFTFTVRVENSSGDGESKTFTLTVNKSAPTINTTILNAGTVNVDYDFDLEAQGTQNIVWSITSGALPSGLTLSTAGKISGKPTEYGSFKFTVAADNNQGTDDAEFTLKIDEPGLEINAENFPDENFRAYISSNFDTNNNGYLSDAEISSVLKIEAYNKKISDLTGIEYFTALQQLYCHNNAITSLDLTNNTKLTLVQANNNGMVSIDLSANTKLSNLQLQDNKLSKLDLSANIIKQINVQNNNLSELDLSVTSITTTANATLSTQNLSGLTISRSDDVYVADLSGYVSDLTKISSVKAYNDSGSEITSTYDNSTGIIQAESLPAYLIYEYDTGKLSMTMEVKVSPNSEPVIVNQTSLPGITSSDIISSSEYSYTFEATGDTPLTWAVESGSLPDGLTLDTSTGKISGTPTYSGTSKFILSVSNSAGTASKDFTLYVAPVPPIFNLDELPSAEFGTAYSQELNVTGTKPIGFSIVSGALPDGLSMSSSTGAITGTPTKGGDFEFTIEANNRVSSVRKTYTITVEVEEETVPQILTSYFDAAVLKAAYDDALLEATGSGDITWSVSSGKLPTGLKISGDIITGTPTAKGTFTFTLKATNSYGSDTKEFSILVTEVPVISTTKLTNGTVGKTYSVKLAVKNSVAVTWSITEGTLPNGLTLDSDTGKITGTPTEMCTNLALTFKAENDVGSATKELKLTIKGVKPTIKSVAKNFPAGIVGQEYSADLTYTGTAPITLTATNLPDGLEMSATGAITGTPTKSGTYNVTFKAVNGTGNASKKIKIEIYDTPEIADVNLKEGTYEKSYTATFKLAKGPKKVTWSLAEDSAELPTGLKFAKTGKISGKPKAYGTFTFKVKASTVAGDTEKEFTVKINPVAPKISTASVKTGKVNASYSVKLKSKGTAPLTWAYTGELPDGITLDTSTGAITGTPTEAGTFNFTVTLTNDAGTAYKSYKMTIKPLKPVFNVNFPDATVGENYSLTLTAEVGSPVTWTMSKVAGLTLDKDSGVISGAPTKAGKYKITVKAKNASGTVSHQATLIVNAVSAETSTYAAELEDTNEILSVNYFDDDITNSGTLSEFARGEITEDMLNLAFSDEYSIAAVLNAISVNESGYYEIAVELDENSEDGELTWFGFPVDVDESELNSNAIFYDDNSNEILVKPENNLITVSVYLEKGIIYEPVIAVKVR